MLDIVDNIPHDWKGHLQICLKSPVLSHLSQRLQIAFENSVVYPPRDLIFRAFDYCSFEKARVVILGQDPYHGAGQANGLAFSVNRGAPLPPSLRNIFREIERDIPGTFCMHGDLTSWAHQGVLLLNTCLTVEQNSPTSHRNLGWEFFTDEVIRILANDDSPKVFLLWGKDAEKKSSFIQNSKHLCLLASHPSPLSVARGFRGCGHFSKTNDFLLNHGFAPINWNIQ